MWMRLPHALTALPVVMAAAPALAQSTTDRSDYWNYGWNWGWGHMILGPLMMILFWGGIILVIVFAVRWLGGGPSQPARNRALDILHERFARGEIDRQEFEERKRVLSD